MVTRTEWNIHKHITININIKFTGNQRKTHKTTFMLFCDVYIKHQFHHNHQDPVFHIKEMKDFSILGQFVPYQGIVW